MVAASSQNKTHLMEQAKDLAGNAMLMHDEALTVATDILNASLRDAGSEDRKGLALNYRPYYIPNGTAMVVSILDQSPDEAENHCELLVVTKQNPLKVTNDAIATPVDFTTRIMTIVDNFAFVVWEKTTSKIINTSSIDEFLY